MSRRIGVTTVARWMAEKMPKGITAYMEHRKRLYRLRQIRATNGRLIPLLDCLLFRQYQLDHSPCSLGTPVFLSINEDLHGVGTEKIVGCAELASFNCYAINSAFAFNSELIKQMQSTKNVSNSPADMFYG
jgi:hypothetical protein